MPIIKIIIPETLSSNISLRKPFMLHFLDQPKRYCISFALKIERNPKKISNKENNKEIILSILNKVKTPIKTFLKTRICALKVGEIFFLNTI